MSAATRIAGANARIATNKAVASGWAGLKSLFAAAGDAVVGFTTGEAKPAPKRARKVAAKPAAKKPVAAKRVVRRK